MSEHCSHPPPLLSKTTTNYFSRWPLGIVIVYQGSGEFIPMLAKKYPQLPIIFSTWKSTKISRSDISSNHWLVRSKSPLWRGPSNLNLQKTSTLAGLRLAQELGFDYALKIRDDMDLEPLDEAIKQLKIKSQTHPKTAIWFLDWVLHLSGYPMDFLQFGKTSDLIAVWQQVTMWAPNAGLAGIMPEITCPEIRLKRAYCRKFGPDPYKQIGFLASEFMANSRVDVLWMKRHVTMRRDWVGNPQFVQLSAYRGYLAD